MPNEEPLEGVQGRPGAVFGWVGAVCVAIRLVQETMSVIIVDGQPVPDESVYGDIRPIPIRPIGFVVREEHLNRDQTPDDVSEIRLLPGMERFMLGLEDETSLVVLWHFDQAQSVRTRFPRGWDGKEVGPFASRTPHRLTPIGVSEVELLKVRGTRLFVRGLEAFDGTPVLDIKVSLESLRQGGRRGGASSRRTRDPA
jgi:tRNA-Thr(GGU) m(6)t(6)A37 methyltransferase TsaA